jgi:Zn finger protein HypA/HybF involved in hydrogenase expression
MNKQSQELTMNEEWWDFICRDCRWRGVAQELGQDELIEEYWHCPKCKSIDIEQVGWHKGNKKQSH